MANPGAPPPPASFPCCDCCSPTTHPLLTLCPSPLQPTPAVLRTCCIIHPPARPPGNGTKGSDYRGGKAGAAQALNSPWDLSLDPSEGQVYIAMAGQHQLWRYDVASGVAGAQGIDAHVRRHALALAVCARHSGVAVCLRAEPGPTG